MINMILGMGVDIISIARIKDSIENSGAVFLDEVFTPAEQRRAQSHPNAIAYYATVFAAKEAIFKCFGIGWESGVKLKEIEIGEGEFGEPVPSLTGTFAGLARKRSDAKVFISLSHETDYAVATAILIAEEGKNRGPVRDYTRDR